MGSVVGLLIIVGVVAYPELGAEESQQELVAHAVALEIGLTRAEARQRIAALPREKLRFYESPGSWSVHTPYRFGARNWLMLVEFSDDRIRCIRVRLADSVRVRPTKAPADRCREGGAGNDLP
jgi:hypothetical protein